MSSAPGAVEAFSVALREITPANRALVEELRVSSEQEAFVDGVTRSLAEAAAEPASRPWLRAVYAGDDPVGFVIVADDVLIPVRSGFDGAQTRGGTR